MRPVPRSRHVMALAIFVAVAAIYGGEAFYDQRLDREQLQLATAAVKRHSPELFPRDMVFGPSRMSEMHPPLFLAIMEMVLIPTDYRDPTLPFRVLAPIVALVYLCGMYSLMRRHCRSWSISALVAVASSVVIETMGRCFWGAGAMTFVTPQGLVIAVTPLIALALLIYANQWRVLLVFLATGLLANIDMTAATNLMLVLLVVYLAGQNWKPRALAMGAACLLCAAAAAAPYVWYFYTLAGRTAEFRMAPYIGQYAPMVSLQDSGILYGPGKLLGDLGQWGGMLAAPVILTAVVLSLVERFRVRDLKFWLVWTAAALGAATVLYGGMYILDIQGRVPPPTTDYLQAVSLVMLPFYALLAQALTNLFRLFHPHRHLLRWLCAAALVAWMLPTDNLRVARHQALDLATMFLPDNEKPANVLRHRESDRSRQQLRRLAMAAREHTPVDAMFITESLEFRLVSQRSILVSIQDMIYLHRLAPGKLTSWYRCLCGQQKALPTTQGPGDGAALVLLAKEITTAMTSPKGPPDPNWKSDAQWYAVLPATADIAGPGIQEVPWAKPAPGDYYRIVRLR
ncbi:MAG: hypothetical protein LLG01_11125 [Planctomycetaceae bacterium]|nr:hypothetical protein [Planctomycetaceae bacterium]